jgi:ligand-binding SRPBCC domain-containing protein
MTHHLSVRLELPKPVEAVFDFFARAENLERITPPELHFRILTPGPIAMAAGTLIDYELRLFLVPFRWRTEITNWDPPHQFVDVQRQGPYREWIHRHRFIPTSRGTEILDDVQYRLPLAPLGEIAYPVVRLQLGRVFSYRTEAVRRLLGGDAPEAASRPRRQG